MKVKEAVSTVIVHTFNFMVNVSYENITTYIVRLIRRKYLRQSIKCIRSDALFKECLHTDTCTNNSTESNNNICVCS